MTTLSARDTEIVLVRHGRSAHVERRWLDADGIRGWMRAYDAAGIAPELPPPPALVELARTAHRIVCSDLPRATASAAVLAGPRAVELTPLLREAPLETPELPLPRLAGLRLPLGAWALVMGVRWIRASMRGAPPPGVDAAVLARAGEAAAWLAEQAGAAAGGRLLVVTHNTVRTLLAAELLRRGWRGPARRPFREWSAWQFRAPDALSAAAEHSRP